ncbi:MAG TPA: TlpA disulfide reductase family protein [Caldilineaceae bacterium]|nr:TlpA disulfide reductase family protein [Caldilineaceae bacterium]
MNRWLNRWLMLFVALAIGGPLWLWASRVPLDAQPANLAPEPAIGRPAPDFTLQTLDGQRFTLHELRGTPVVLNFWATWCGPCQREMPTLQTTAERYAGQVAIIGIDQAEEPEVVQRYIDSLGVTFPIPLDTDSTVAQRYNVRGMPTTFFVDEDGIIRHIWMGEMNSVTLAEGIAKIWP